MAVTKSSTQTPEGFRRFLSWLDEGVDSNGERYVEMRRRLVSYFAHRRCPSPDDLADETLTRIARKLEDEGSIRGASPAHYCYITARFVFLEHLRAADRRQTSLDEGRQVPEPAVHPAAAGDRDARETLLDRLDRCLQKLNAYDRALILEYYSGGEAERIARRRDLAAQLHLTPNALSIRACRIRDAVEACVAQSSGT